VLIQVVRGKVCAVWPLHSAGINIEINTPEEPDIFEFLENTFGILEYLVEIKDAANAILKDEFNLVAFRVGGGKDIRF
jgi:hypothetical protein